MKKKKNLKKYVYNSGTKQQNSLKEKVLLTLKYEIELLSFIVYTDNTLSLLLL